MRHSTTASPRYDAEHQRLGGEMRCYWYGVLLILFVISSVDSSNAQPVGSTERQEGYGYCGRFTQDKDVLRNCPAAAEDTSRPNSFRASALERLAQYHERKGELLNSLNYLDRALTLWPQEDAFDLRGRIRQRLRRFDGAISDFDTALRLTDEPCRYFAFKVQTFRRQREFQLANQVSGQALQKCKRAPVLGDRALTYLESGDTARAEKDIADALAEDRFEPLALVARARTRTLFDQSMTDLGIALNSDPTNYEARLDRSYILFANGQLQLALDDLEVLLVDEVPGDVDALFARARVLSVAGHTDRAIDDLDTIIRSSSDLAEAHLLRGDLRFDRGQLDLAILDYSAAIRIQPKEARGYFSRGDAYRETMALEKAIADFSMAIRLAPQEPLLWLNRCALYLRSGQIALASADFGGFVLSTIQRPVVAIVIVSLTSLILIFVGTSAAAFVHFVWIFSKVLLGALYTVNWWVVSGALAWWLPILLVSLSTAAAGKSPQLVSFLLGVIILAGPLVAVTLPVIRDFLTTKFRGLLYVQSVACAIALPATMGVTMDFLARGIAADAKTSVYHVSQQMFHVNITECAQAFHGAFGESTSVEISTPSSTQGILFWVDNALSAALFDAPAAFGCKLSTLDYNSSNTTISAVVILYRAFVVLILLVVIVGPISRRWLGNRIEKPESA